MKKMIFLATLFFLSSSALMAQDFFNPNKGLEPKVFGSISKGDKYELRVKFESKPFWQSKIDIQLIYNGVPNELKGDPNSIFGDTYAGDSRARFLDKDGFEIENTTLFTNTMCVVENQNLTCRSDMLISAEDYRKISTVVVSKT